MGHLARKGLNLLLLKVILGGGRRAFLPATEPDPETNAMGVNHRLDGQNLVQRWKTSQMNKNKRYNYVWRKQEFEAVDPKKVDYLLGESIRNCRNIFSIFCNFFLLFFFTVYCHLWYRYICITLYISEHVQLKLGLKTNSYSFFCLQVYSILHICSTS